MRWLTIALVALTAGACEKPDLGSEGFVEGLRILGAQAEPPEAAPGDTVTLTAWVVDTHGGAIAVDWSACLLPSSGLANSACVTTSNNGRVALGSGATLMTTVPMVSREMLGAPDATDGVYLPIILHAATAADQADAIYRLRIAGFVPVDKDDKRNKNPAFLQLDPLVEDVPQPVMDDMTWALLAEYTNDSAEQYHILSASPEAVFERLTTQWFASGGRFNDEPVGGTGVQALRIDTHLPPHGGAFDLWVVGHDERGGTTMLHRTFIRQ